MLRAPYPLTAPKTFISSNYPEAWQQSYSAHNYLQHDPVVQHCCRSLLPVAWSGEHTDSDFWAEASAHGIKHGWAQSYRNPQNFSGMLSLARPSEPMSAAELTEKNAALAWLTQIAVAGFYPMLSSKMSSGEKMLLTAKEKELLRWTADGKSVEQIAEILHISERTVTFHMQHVLDKLGAPNKVSAAVQAVLLGLL